MPYKDPETARQCARDYYAAHKEELIAYQKAYYAIHKEQRKAHYNAHQAERKAYRDAHKGQIKQHNRQSARKIKIEVLTHYSIGMYPICAHCGEEDLDVLCIDHINNDGAKHRQTAGLGINLYAWLKRNNYPKGLQVLCANCNLKKEILRRRK